MTKIYIGGETRDMTPAEQAEYDAHQAVEAAKAGDYALIRDDPKVEEILDALLAEATAGILSRPKRLHDLKARRQAARDARARLNRV